MQGAHNKRKREFMDKCIGHAIQHVNEFELKSYFAVIYGLIEVEDVLDKSKHIVEERFNQYWRRLGKVLETSLPGLKCPVSCVIFWCNRLGFDLDHYQEFENIGYFNIEEFKAEIRGYYKFYVDTTR